MHLKGTSELFAWFGEGEIEISSKARNSEMADFGHFE